MMGHVASAVSTTGRRTFGFMSGKVTAQIGMNLGGSRMLVVQDRQVDELDDNEGQSDHYGQKSISSHFRHYVTVPRQGETLR